MFDNDNKWLMQGDCLERMKEIESGSVDMILTDPPYGTMNTDGGRKLNINNWDITINTEALMQEVNRILRKNGKMVLFAQEPYTTELITGAIPNLPFNYRITWEKDTFANALGCKKAPVNYTEDILVFSKNHAKHDFEACHPLRDYFKQVMQFIGLNIKQINSILGHRRAEHTFYINSTQFSLCTEKTYSELVSKFSIDEMQNFKLFNELKLVDKNYRKDLIKRMSEQYPSVFNLWDGKKFKSNILKYKKDHDGLHPTQKPVALLEDLIKTYTNENNTVLDFTMGSGSTGVAAKNLNRNFIGIELDEGYFNIAKNRISQ